MKRFFLCALGALLLLGCNNEKADSAENPATTPATETAPQDATFADAKYAAIGKKGVAALSAGDVDGWMSNYAHNAVYVWNSGDSIAGKTAIADYWKKRRTEVIDSISFSKSIWLPVNVNKPQSTEKPGVWLLCWYQVDAKYKTGKRMTQWIHTDIHFTANDSIDRVIMYLDRSLIAAATGK
jgi:hypothetical protein